MIPDQETTLLKAEIEKKRQECDGIKTGTKAGIVGAAFSGGLTGMSVPQIGAYFQENSLGTQKAIKKAQSLVTDLTHHITTVHRESGSFDAVKHKIEEALGKKAKQVIPVAEELFSAIQKNENPIKLWLTFSKKIQEASLGGARSWLIKDDLRLGVVATATVAGIAAGLGIRHLKNKHGLQRKEELNQEISHLEKELQRGQSQGGNEPSLSR